MKPLVETLFNSSIPRGSACLIVWLWIKPSAKCINVNVNKLSKGGVCRGSHTVQYTWPITGPNWKRFSDAKNPLCWFFSTTQNPAGWKSKQRGHVYKWLSTVNIGSFGCAVVPLSIVLIPSCSNFLKKKKKSSLRSNRFHFVRGLFCCPAWSLILLILTTVFLQLKKSRLFR